MSYPTHLIKINSSFYYKIKVPADLAHLFPCRFIKKSTILQRKGFIGGYDSVRPYVQHQRKEAGGGVTAAFIPLSYSPGEAFQFDWSYEQIELGGANVKIKVAQFRLCNSRMPFYVAYTRESLEMVLDAHIRAFDFFGGACRRGIYDNLKTVVTKVLMGKDRVFNRRFLCLASHYLFEPVACTPAADWRKDRWRIR